MSTIKDRKCKDLTEAEEIKKRQQEYTELYKKGTSLVAQRVKNLPAMQDKESACNAGDVGLIPGLGRSAGEGNATHSSILAWRIPWTDEPGRLQPMGLQRVRYD